MLNFIFDVTYYGLALVMLGLSGYTIVAGFVLRRAVADPLERRETVGLSLVAVGALLTLAGGVVFLAMERGGQLGGPLYQQVQFAVFYIAFALILYGMVATARRWPLLLWLGYVVAIGIASVVLLNPSSGAKQQLVYWVPLFYVTAVGVLLLPLRATRGCWHPLWLALCFAALLVGLLRESTIIPSSGNPELDLLAAFVPFVVATFCLFLTMRSLAAESMSRKR
jgi:hypothetical protein